MSSKFAILTILVLLFGVTSIAFAQPDKDPYRDMDYKLAYDPTVCATEPEESEIDGIGESLVDQTRLSLLDWQTKLRETTRNKDHWTLSFIPVTFDQKKNFDYTRCDIEVYFQREPQDEDQKFRVLGTTSLDELSSKPIVTIYYLQIDPNLKYHEAIEGNIIYYWHEGMPRYLDTPRNDDQLASVIRHEIGHAIGLGHYMVYDPELYAMWEGATIAPPSIVIPLTPDFTGHLGITPSDIEKIISIYGQNGFGPKPLSVDESKKMRPTLSTIVLEPYENEKYQFSMGIPKGWSIEDSERIEASDPIVFLQDGSEYNSVWMQVYLSDKREDSVTSEKYLTVLANEEEKRCKDISLEVEQYTCENFKVKDSDVIQIKDKKAYQITYSWTQNKKFLYGTIITEIPSGDKVWRIAADIYGPDYGDFIGRVDSTINSFMLISDTPTQPKETIEPAKPIESPEPIPSWIKNNAKWWSEGSINDDDFTKGIQFLIEKGIMKIPKTTSSLTQQDQKIPNWIKNNAKWWANDQISDDDFIKGIQYLVEHGIVKV